MREEVKLGIIIPFYKMEFFDQTLSSLARQTNKNFVLYIGNDASGHDPKCLMDSLLVDVEYCYFNYDINFGKNNLASQWERILENVKEDWFQILGDDDFLEEDFVMNFIGTMKR